MRRGAVGHTAAAGRGGMTALSSDMVEQSITRRRDARLGPLLRAALAGARALVAAGARSHRVKQDGTPQTDADLASDAAIRAVLAKELPGLAIVSEEEVGELPADFADRPFVLVDPLDGTREYMEGHPDHAVCIAIIENRRPVLGAIVAPMVRRAWTAEADARVFRLSAALELEGPGEPVHVATQHLAAPRLVTSRSRPDPFAAALMPAMPGATLHPLGAVLKLVAVATGEACLFPAGNPSSEWDIAAGEALVLAAGGCMLGVDGRPILYGDAANRFRHPPYAAGSTEAMVRSAISQWAAN
jgi:3'(2'), 5'-bisphosphate nucleotidase